MIFEGHDAVNAQVEMIQSLAVFCRYKDERHFMTLNCFIGVGFETPTTAILLHLCHTIKSE